MTEISRQTILLVGDDEALSYLIERYAHESGFGVNAERTLPRPSDGGQLDPMVAWVSSIEVLATFRPRESGLISDDVPVVVCSSVPDDQRARELGADVAVLHPVTYKDFVAALAAVGVQARERVPAEKEGRAHGR